MMPGFILKIKNEIPLILHIAKSFSDETRKEERS